MTMIDDHDLEAPGKAVKLAAGDWRKLAALSIGVIVLFAGVSYALAASIVSARLEDIADVKTRVQSVERRVDFAERDIASASNETAEIKKDLKEAIRVLNKISAALEARGFPIAQAAEKPAPQGT